MNIQELNQKMSAHIFVVAGNYKQFESLLIMSYEQWDKEIKRKQIHYVHEHEMLIGILPSRVFVYGSYFKRKDWPEIEKAIETQGHRKLLIR